MRSLPRVRSFFWLTAASLGLILLHASSSQADHLHRTKKFSGAKVNAGTVTHTVDGKKDLLTLSDDFQVPDTPDPHWQVVDSKGTAYLLQRLKIKGDKINTSIAVPGYVRDIARVQIWCAWAETLLGEAAFEKPVTLARAAN
jgi:hypothetical protein